MKFFSCVATKNVLFLFHIIIDLAFVTNSKPMRCRSIYIVGSDCDRCGWVLAPQQCTVLEYWC